MQSLLDDVPILLAYRFLTAFATTLVLHDHALTLGDEVRYMWSNLRSNWLTKVTYFVSRYSTDCIFLYSSYASAGVATNLNADVCKRFTWLFTMAAALFLLTMQVTVVLRMYTIWEGRRLVVRLVGLVFALTFAAVIPLAVFTARDASRSMFYSPIGNTCAILSKPIFVSYLLGCLTFFDLLIVILSVINGLEIPHASHSALVYTLRRDGAIIFACLFLLRLAAFILSLSNDPVKAIMMFPVIWSFLSVGNGRMCIWISAAAHKASRSHELHGPDRADYIQGQSPSLRPGAFELPFRVSPGLVVERAGSPVSSQGHASSLGHGVLDLSYRSNGFSSQ